MTPVAVARTFAALGHHDRIRICHLLILSGDQGVSRRAIGATLAISPAMLNYHLGMLRRVDLIRDRREGRKVSCVLNGRIIDGLSKYLSDDPERGRMEIYRSYSYEHCDE